MSAKMSKNSVFDLGLCRCCGVRAQCRVLNEKHYDMGRKEVYSEMIKNCFGVELSHLHGKPMDRLVCALCVDKIRQAITFKVQVLQSEQAFLQSRMYTLPGSKDHRNMTQYSMGFVKREMGGLEDYFSDDDVMSDGFDDEIGPELLKEYYSLESYEDTSFGNTQLANVLSGPKKRQYSNTKIIHENGASDVGGYASADDVPIQTLETERKQRVSPKLLAKQHSASEIDQTEQAFMQATNVAYIVKYSYACPFKTRFNHILCYYCHQYFLDPVLLREHTLTHSPKKFKATRNRYSKLDLTRIDCRLCTEKIEDLEDFKRHLVASHGKHYFLESKDCVLPFKLVENVNKCTLCREEFSYFDGLHKHMSQHFSNYMCETCGMGFMDEISLQKHAPMHDGKRYPCKTCGKTFKSEYTRLCHIQRIHKKNESVSFCTKCEARLLLHERTKHMVEVHGASATVPCLGCDQVFNSRRLLTVHVRREHMKDYRYECQVCHKKFFRRSALTFHMPTHTGERNFKCKVCEKSYPRLKTLKEHMKIHNNDRRYRCHICGQAFVQNCSLKGHMKSKHPEY